jgi:hypothetical protein
MQIGVVYASLATAIAILLNLELAATLLLLGAQVIAEYERIATEPLQASLRPLTTAQNCRRCRAAGAARTRPRYRRPVNSSKRITNTIKPSTPLGP